MTDRRIKPRLHTIEKEYCYFCPKHHYYDIRFWPSCPDCGAPLREALDDPRRDMPQNELEPPPRDIKIN